MNLYQAAFIINGVVKSGSSHLDILSTLTPEEKVGEIQHGYVDLIGNFYDNIDCLFKTMRHILLIRHAQTWHNVKESDDLDASLTPQGEEQALRLSQYLSKLNLQGYVGLVSPFLRTLQTASIIKEKTNLNFKVLPLLAEYGQIAQWMKDSGKESYLIRVPNRSDQFVGFDWSGFTEEIFQDETVAEFKSRMKYLLENSLSEKTLIVSHGAVIWTLIDLLTGGTLLQNSNWCEVPNASVSFLEGQNPIYLFKNEWEHDNRHPS
jgi:broad specificity phosphatase PhoE